MSISPFCDAHRDREAHRPIELDAVVVHEAFGRGLAVRQRLDGSAQFVGRALEQRREGLHDRCGAEPLARLQDALGAHPGRRHLRMHVAAHQLGLPAVGEDEPLQIVVEARRANRFSPAAAAGLPGKSRWRWPRSSPAWCRRHRPCARSSRRSRPASPPRRSAPRRPCRRHAAGRPRRGDCRRTCRRRRCRRRRARGCCRPDGDRPGRGRTSAAPRSGPPRQSRITQEKSRNSRMMVE